MEMEPQKPAVTMVAVDHVVLVPPGKNVAREPVTVYQVALAETVEMMDVEVTHVVSVPHLRPVPMVFVPEQPLLIVPVEPVDPTVLVEAADPVQLGKDAVLDNANVTMTAMKEIVVMLFNQKEPTPAYVPKDLVEHAHLVLLVDPMADAQLKLLVLSQSQSLIVTLDVRFHQVHLLQLAPSPLVTVRL